MDPTFREQLEAYRRGDLDRIDLGWWVVEGRDETIPAPVEVLLGNLLCGPDEDEFVMRIVAEVLRSIDKYPPEEIAEAFPLLVHAPTLARLTSARSAGRTGREEFTRFVERRMDGPNRARLLWATPDRLRELGDALEGDDVMEAVCSFVRDTRLSNPA